MGLGGCERACDCVTEFGDTCGSSIWQSGFRVNLPVQENGARGEFCVWTDFAVGTPKFGWHHPPVQKGAPGEKNLGEFCCSSFIVVGNPNVRRRRPPILERSAGHGSMLLARWHVSEVRPRVASDPATACVLERCSSGFATCSGRTRGLWRILAVDGSAQRSRRVCDFSHTQPLRLQAAVQWVPRISSAT